MPLKRFGVMFQPETHFAMASINAGTLQNIIPRRNRRSMSSLNHRSTRFSKGLHRRRSLRLEGLTGPPEPAATRHFVLPRLHCLAA